MYWLIEYAVLPSNDPRRPLTVESFLRFLYPPIACFYLSAILVLLPHTRILRITLLPLTLWLFFRGAMALNISLGFDARLAYLNKYYVIAVTLCSLRTTTWSFQKKPFRRVKTLAEVTPDLYKDGVMLRRTTYWELFMDALDLCINLRGCGWNWSVGIPIPRETRSTSSALAFLIATSASFISYLFLTDVSHYAVQWFGPTTIGSSEGGTIFDMSLSPAHRYLRATTISFLGLVVMYSLFQATYHLSTIVGVLVFRQHPSLWPPAFDSPFLSTSLTEVWAKRWHQFCRDSFTSVGGYPLSLIMGRPGILLGTFLVSATFHDLAFWGTGYGMDCQNIGGFLLMNGVGIALEYIWRGLTGRRVRGPIGWVWMAVWLAKWGNNHVDAWSRKGLLGFRLLPVPLRPSTYIFGALPGHAA